MAAKKLKPLKLLEPILIETFGLTRVFKPTPELAEWLSVTGTLNEMDSALIAECQAKLIENADSWNEEELKMEFISMVIFLARFKSPIRTYYDREISATIEGTFVSTKADMMLSKGIGELIKTPYFFLHEYKREKKYSGDPVGQMLGGMLVGQAKNNNEKPIYGCYVQGRFWFFATLIGKKYVISKGYDSSEMEDVIKVIVILRFLNDIILQRLIL
jgi:hypothetical protein